jgi:hypothetical protein
MPIETNLRIVDKNTGNTIITVDENGFKDVSNRVFQAPKFLTERLTATPLAAYMWTCLEGVWQVQIVHVKASVTGGAGATVDVLVSPGVVAPAGTTQLTAPIAMTATAPFSLYGTLITTPTFINPGDSVSRVIAGTPGSVEALLTVQLKRVG